MPEDLPYPSQATLPVPDHFILASTSPRRRQFLQALNIPFTVIAPGSAAGSSQINETPHPYESPTGLVQRLSQAKAQTIVTHLPALFPDAARYRNLVVIAADTEVALGHEILGKPADADEAVAMLARLGRQAHSVYSGLTIVRMALENIGLSQWVTRLHHSQVWMRRYSQAEIEAYVASGSPLDKAGAYGIQDEQFAPVARLDGCFASVMGFPLAELAVALHQVGLQLPPVAPICTALTNHSCCQAQ